MKVGDRFRRVGIFGERYFYEWDVGWSFLKVFVGIYFYIL